MERTSERIWRAARAAYESRLEAIEMGMAFRAPSDWAWDGVSQARRDIDYDAMVAAFEAVDALWIAIAGGGEGEAAGDGGKVGLRERIAELEAVAKALLPGEIAGLIERLESGEASPEEKTTAAAMISAALRALAQENERLHERLEDNHEFQLKDGTMIRVEVKPGSVPDGIECRDETIKLKRGRISELEAERDAIRAKTIEECALVLDHAEAALGNRALADFANDMASTIRALAQTDEASQKERR